MCSLGEIAEHCNISVPTATKSVKLMEGRGIIERVGKRHRTGGRMPMMYTLSPKLGNTIGVDIRNNGYYFGTMDFSGNMIKISSFRDYNVNEGTNAEDFARDLLDAIQSEGINIKTLLYIVISVPGRVNVFSGESYNYFRREERNATEIISSIIGVPVKIDNDSRLMCLGEYIENKLFSYKNILYVNVGWGLGMGMILDGKLYYGANGFSGELGHISIFDNEIFCQCGKKGCLETEASGLAVCRQLAIRHKAGARSTLSNFIENGSIISPETILEAVQQGDMLIIEIIEEMGAHLGKGLATMMNVLNPELLILGGPISKSNEHLLMSTISSIRKYSINIVNRATTISLCSNQEHITIYGACHMARMESVR